MIIRVFVLFFSAWAATGGVGVRAQGNSLQTADTDPLTGLTDAEVAQGWLSLFDGETLFGWKAESEVDWHVDQGAIHATTGQQGLLRTTSQFDDFELHLEFQATAGTNSGIFFRTSPRPKSPVEGCYELNIVDDGQHEFTTGALVGRTRAQWALDLTDQPTWHQLALTVDGGRIFARIDGRDILEFVDEKPLGRGFVGLQFNGGTVAFRNVRLRPLNLEPWFNGHDLQGWSAQQSLESKFEVNAQQELVLRGGRGQLESEQQLQDFVFSLDCFTHQPNTNSGVFFRCIPGEVMNGYESQIHNGTVDGDVTKPADAGTGAIFRRVAARRVVARDQQWLRKTIIATGPHVSVWVNGYQVTDWSDTRPDHENPRNGRRLTGGTIALQGHDPGTHISFRNLRGKELMPRNPNEHQQTPEQ